MDHGVVQYPISVHVCLVSVTPGAGLGAGHTRFPIDGKQTCIEACSVSLGDGCLKTEDRPAHA
jgi:hypothetical protein